MAEPFLRAERITVRFGGHVAVHEVSISADRGEIVGVIGPNGAGKTTLFDAVAGARTPDTGHVHLDGVDVTGWSSHRRARAGLGRTFQRLEVFGSMTVRENLAFATEAAELGAKPWRLFGRSRPDDAVTDEAIELLGLGDVAGARVGDLPTGRARVVELGRALCARPALVLLDEPSSGLDPTETAELADAVRRTVATHGLGVVLVEHDVAMVMSLCERLYVLDFGELIAEGPAELVAGNPAVQAAYLGAG